MIYRKRSVLTLLLATCEVTLQSSREAEFALHDEFASAVEQVIERTRAETDRIPKPKADTCGERMERFPER